MQRAVSRAEGSSLAEAQSLAAKGRSAKGRGQREEMADTHEEQLLSELLSSIARDDERLEAAHLESRVMATLDTSPAPWFRPNTTHVVIAAAVVMAVLGTRNRMGCARGPAGCKRDACRAAPAEGRRHTGRIC